MHTVHPSIIIGSYGWDEDRLPRDEFQLRRAELDGVMDARGWKAMLIFGDAAEHRALAYYTNFVPRLRWGMALIPREGEPLLLCSMSSRDMPAMRLMTWIPDVRSGWEWQRNFDPWLARFGAEGSVDIGTIGLDVMTLALFGQLERSLGNRFRLHDADFVLPDDRALRPREVSLLRQSCVLASGAAAAMAEAWRAGQGNEQAALAAERKARLAAAQDVRTLISPDGGRTLVPFSGALGRRTDPFLGYIVVKSMGFWAELFVSASGRPRASLDHAKAGLDAALAAMRPGAVASAIHAKAAAALAPLALHPVLSSSVGRRIGLSLDEGGALRQDGTAALKAGNVYALHVGGVDAAGGAIVSAMVAMTPGGPEILCRSSW